MVYTKKQIKLLISLREGGRSWPYIAERMNKECGVGLSPEAYRSLYRRQKDTTPPKRAKAKIKPPVVREEPILKNNERVLFISDMHIPYQHPDTFKFLQALKEKYEPTRVVCVGDEVDKHAMSFHDSDPDLSSAGDELEASIKELKKLYKIFPVMDLVDSNHGSMVYRKGKHHGIPRKYLRDYGEVLEAPKGWVWHMDLTLILPDGNECYVHHGLSKDVAKVVTQRGVCVVQGHYHTEFRVCYSGNPNSLLWGMNVGCSIDKESLAFAYDRTNLGRPVLGHGITINGLPHLLPMILNKHGRWTGVVP